MNEHLDVDAFYLEHLHCGELDAGVEGDRVWITSTCGARIALPVATKRR